MLNRYSVLSLLLILAACHAASSRIEPKPVPEDSPSPTPAVPEFSARGTWVIMPTNERHRYRSTTSSIIAFDDVNSPVRDSTSASIDYSIAVSREAEGGSYSATLETLSVHGGNRAVLPASNIHLPFSFTGHFESGKLTVDPPTQQVAPLTDCTNQISSALPTVHRSIVMVPLQLRKDMTWTDSTSINVCSGAIPVMLTALRTYRVLGETSVSGHQQIVLERLDKALSTGEGSEGQHRIQLRSEGSGQTQLLINASTGSLIEATGTNTTTITVTTSGRSQRFVQASREHVSER